MKCMMYTPFYKPYKRNRHNQNTFTSSFRIFIFRHERKWTRNGASWWTWKTTWNEPRNVISHLNYTNTFISFKDLKITKIFPTHPQILLEHSRMFFSKRFSEIKKSAARWQTSSQIKTKIPNWKSWQKRNFNN